VTAQLTMRARMPSISFIVARSYPGNVIGYKNALPWHLRSDLKNFRKITTNHVIIMGRKTHVSIGKALPNRTNLVMTRSEILANRHEIDVDSDTDLIFTNTYEDTLFVADVVSICRGNGDIFIIGGGTMYELFGRFVNRVFLTQVIANVQGDAFFNMEFDRKEWKTVSEESFAKEEGINDYPFMFSVLERRERQYRHKLIKNFMTEIEIKRSWIKKNLDMNRPKFEKYFQENLELDV
jgi:dihydrofolate reductase